MLGLWPIYLFTPSCLDPAAWLSEFQDTIQVVTILLYTVLQVDVGWAWSRPDSFQVKPSVPQMTCFLQSQLIGK